MQVIGPTTNERCCMLALEMLDHRNKIHCMENDGKESLIDILRNSANIALK